MFQNDENIFIPIPLNGEEFWKDINIFNIVPLNGEEIWNYVIFVNLIPIKRRILKLCKICQFWQLKGEEFYDYEK